MKHALCVALLLGASSALAQPAAVSQFTAAYAAGDVAALPFSADATSNGLPARHEYATLFAITLARSLELQHVRASDSGRVTADYAASVDGKHYEGSVTFYVRDDAIERMVWDDTVWPESEAMLLAESGQMADKGSTAFGLASGRLAEANPLLATLGPGGMLAFGATIAGVRYVLVRDLPLSECIALTRQLSAFGWGAGANNVAALTGVALPVAPLIGLIAGAIAWNQDYKGECV